ncbi:cold shock domain-containing protein E1-like isoform X1 [Pecten maximus]|uniref:cold shock domain-containing protein E1-like isoform X1 n=1 Tax=Pecten maximus TaxID=6579 RepID=UPI001458CDC4|nr:cold shock domain-containing protein E1-like isoform X1 [Pecten maximus]
MSAVRKMNSPQWKNFQPPAQDPAILSYQQGSNIVSPILSPTSPTSTSNIRETGLIEKLLHSYGFIQCCDREARLFFHFSEYAGDINTVKIGDAVEFQMSCDRRTGRPIACSIGRIDKDEVSFEVLSEERFTGSIVQEARPVKNKNGCVNGQADGLGRVTYEHNGEWFFLPYGLEDVVETGNAFKIKSGDTVTFYIATDKRNANIHARKLELMSVPAVQSRCQGVVCSMKDSFGFIERADMVKEIFFHYSEFKGDINELILGDDVDFEVQTRNGKEVAVNISSLPEGTVIFEDIGLDKIVGKVIKTLKNGRRQSDPLGGRINFEGPKGLTEMPFGDKDQIGDYTLCQGDLVEFKVATDRRDKLQRATSICLLEKETFEQNKEKRETGVIVSLKDGYGFIHCAERDSRMFFHFSEMLSGDKEVKPQEEVEFTVTQDLSTPDRLMAIRIKYLPKGSVNFTHVRPEKYIGTIEREPALNTSPTKNKDSDCGNIIFDFEGTIQQVPYQLKDLVDPRSPPRYGDKVEFNLAEIKRNNSRGAVNVRVLFRNVASKCLGFVATLKENYGFIESADHEKEIFFHFSSFDGDPTELDLADEVEYAVTRKNAKVSAENIRRVPKGTIPVEEILRDQGVLKGKIVRPMRIVNPEQEEYCGLVQVDPADEGAKPVCYPYGITSLADKRDFLQTADAVKFQLAVGKNGATRAVNIAAVRKYIRARVDSVKGQFGFINYEAAEEGKKLFFHMTEVHDGVDIQAGDEVEFVVVQNQRNKKYSACSVRKITSRQRPERLVSRLKSINDDMISPRMVALRQPKGPDGTGGFAPRIPRQPTV